MFVAVIAHAFAYSVSFYSNWGTPSQALWHTCTPYGLAALLLLLLFLSFANNHHTGRRVTPYGFITLTSSLVLTLSCSLLSQKLLSTIHIVFLLVHCFLMFSIFGLWSERLAALVTTMAVSLVEKPRKHLNYVSDRTGVYLILMNPPLRWGRKSSLCMVALINEHNNLKEQGNEEKNVLTTLHSARWTTLPRTYSHISDSGRVWDIVCYFRVWLGWEEKVHFQKVSPKKDQYIFNW